MSKLLWWDCLCYEHFWAMVTPSWYRIITDEATDVANREQFNSSLRWENDEYDVSEDPVGLVCLPNTSTDSIIQGSPYLLWFVSLSLQRTGLWWGLNHARHTERCCNPNTEWESCCSSRALLCPFLQPLLTRCWKTNPSIKTCSRHCQRNWQTDKEFSENISFI